MEIAAQLGSTLCWCDLVKWTLLKGIKYFFTLTTVHIALESDKNHHVIVFEYVLKIDCIEIYDVNKCLTLSKIVINIAQT